jgi:predicted ATPase
MSKIKIKNFGPIQTGHNEDEGWLEIKKTTVFTGAQGSGKSTVAKLISTFTWMEKALVRGDIKPRELEIHSRFKKRHCAYQGLENYFRDDTVLEYEGDAYIFQYSRNALKVIQNEANKYFMPKVMYVPAERNFVSVVSQPEKLKYLPQTLATFLEEFERSKNELNGSIILPINGLSLEYNAKKQSTFLTGNGFSVLLFQASSGLQSIVPLYLVSKNLSDSIGREGDFSKEKFSLVEKRRLTEKLLKILQDEKITSELKQTAIDLLSSVTQNDCFINIVEEPEQNLFPTSQYLLLNELIGFNNLQDSNKLVFTTHSPFLINHLTIMVKAQEVYENKKSIICKNKVASVIPVSAFVKSENLIIYQLDEAGKISILPSYNGLPSDENYLNCQLGETNDLFNKLLEIEGECE